MAIAELLDNGYSYTVSCSLVTSSTSTVLLCISCCMRCCESISVCLSSVYSSTVIGTFRAGSDAAVVGGAIYSHDRNKQNYNYKRYGSM